MGTIIRTKSWKYVSRMCKCVIKQIRCIRIKGFILIADTSLTGNMMLAGMSLSEYTQLNNMKGKIERLEE